MDKNKLYVDMPDESTIKAQVEEIVAKGLKPKESFYSRLKDMYKQIGLRYLFHDAMEIIFIILLVFTILMGSVVNIGAHDTGNGAGIYVFIFTVSPILYLAMSLLSFLRAKQSGTYEIEMTCKYDMYQVAALRMFIFSIICILFNLAFVYGVVAMHEQIDFLQAFMISVTSLFLFSTVFLSVISRLRSRLAKYFIVVGWVLINIALRIFRLEFYSKFLGRISIYVYLLVTSICIYTYIKKLKRLINMKSVQGGM